VCKGSAYVVFGGWDEPTTAGIDQNQIESHRSQVHFRCATPQELAKNLSEAPAAAKVAPAQANPPPAVTAQAPPPAPTVAPARVCVPGSSQACVGVAACAGGQACLPDGSGFGPCDCGSR
jgi:chemotaxis response regulator CheB